MEKLSAANSTPVKNVTYDANKQQKPYRFACVNNALWIPSHQKSVIRVFDLELTNDKENYITISPNKNITAHSILQINPSEVILASNKGLFTLDVTGEIKYNLSDGFFSDVASNSDFQAAIELHGGFGTKKAHVHKLISEQKKLQLQGTVDLKSVDTYLLVSMTLSKTKIYIADTFNNVVKMYKLNSIFGTIHVPGAHKYPIVSYTDTFGSLLICNWNDNSFEVINNDTKSTKYKLGGITQPLDFLIIKDYVYVLWTKRGAAPMYVTQYSLPTS